MDVDETRTYIERSRNSPLEIFLEREHGCAYLDDAFSLVIPHIHRVKTLGISTDFLPDALRHFRCHTPLLENLHIEIQVPRAPVLDSTLFNGDLSSLRTLNLRNVTTLLPWNNLANLTSFSLTSCTPRRNLITRLLNFFDSAPLLEDIALVDSTPKSSSMQPGRMVPLPHLRKLTVDASQAPSVILNHLIIPTGASLILKFSFSGGESPLIDYLPETSPNLKNLTHITTINLSFGSIRCARLQGPSGGVHLSANWEDRRGVPSYTMDCLIFHSLGTPTFSTTQRLAVSEYRHSRPAKSTECPVFRALSSAPNLRALTLTKCNGSPFIHALNPQTDPHELVLCPKLEELILYTKIPHFGDFRTEDIIDMTRSRDLKGAKLLSIIIVGLNEFELGEEALKLREHVTHVEYRLNGKAPAWDYSPGESSHGSE